MLRKMNMMYKHGVALFNMGAKNSAFMINAAKPMLLINVTARVAIYLRMLEVLSRKMSSTGVHKLATFKIKKFYFTFRPIAKMKD